MVVRIVANDTYKVIYVISRNYVATGGCNSASQAKRSFIFNLGGWNRKNVLCKGADMRAFRMA